MTKQSPPPVLKKQAFKKIAVISILLTTMFIAFTFISVISIFFYIQSEHCSQLLQSQINQRIPGKMEWSKLDISLINGELLLENYRLSLNNEELIAIDKAHISFDLSNIITRSDLSTILNNFDIAKIEKRELIIKDITIEKPRISLSMTSEKKLDIISAFPVAKEDKESEKKAFKLPLRITFNQINIKDGEFSYRSEKALDKPSNGKICIDIKDINLLTNGTIADKADIDLNFSMKSGSSTLSIDGSAKNLLLSSKEDNSEMSEENFKTDKKISEPILNLTLDSKIVTPEILNMLGLANKDKQIANGDISIQTSISGSLNDPSISCLISYPDEITAKLKDSNAKIMGRIVKKSIVNVIMEKREVTIKTLEIEHPYAALKAEGNISLSKAFPHGFLFRKEATIDKFIILENITGKVTIACDNIDAGKLLESENIKGIKGKGSFKVDFLGNLNNPEVKLTLKANNAGYKEYPVLESGDFDLLLSNGVVKINKCDIASSDSSVKLDGTIKVLEQEKNGNLKPMGDPAFDLTAKSDKINITEILKSLNVLKTQKIIATLEANATLTGTAKNPKVTLNANGKNLELAGQKIGAVRLKAGYQNKKTVIDSLLVTLDSSNVVEAKAWMDQKQTAKQQQNSKSKQNSKFKLDIFSNRLDLALIESLKKSDAIKGVASGSISAEGFLDSLKSSRVIGDVGLKQVKIMDKPFQDFTAKLDLKDNRLNLNGRLNFDIAGNFDLKSKDFAVQGIFNKTELLPWFAFAEIKAIESGTISGTVDLKGNANNLDKISGRCNLSELSINLFNDPAIFADGSETKISAISKLKSTNKNNKKMVVKADNIKAMIDGKEFRVDKFKTLLPENGEVILAASGNIGGDIKAQADATLPVRFASLFIKELPDIKGVVRLNLMADVKSGDDIKNSDLDATIEFVDIAVKVPVNVSNDNPEIVNFHGMNGLIKADFNRVEITQITGKVSDGKLKGKKSGDFKLSGGAKLVNFMPEDINMTLNAREIPINMIEDLTASFDTELNFKGNLKSATILWGTVLINHGAWTGDIHVEKKIVSTLTEKKRVRKEVKQTKEANPLLENMKLNIAVKGEKPFIIDNNLAYMEVHPDIRIRGTAASPVVSGRSEIEPGIINYQSTKFELTRGIIDFANPYKIEPELDIESHRTVRDWDILLAVSGTPANINFKLTSKPRLEDGDIISLLIRGKTVTELISAEGGTTLSAAGMLSQVAASAVSDKVKSATGLDIFEVGFNNKTAKTGSNTNNDDSEIGNLNVTVGKELTDKITLKYGTENKDGIMVGKTSAEYKLMENVSVSGFQDSEGQFGGEVRYRLEFR
ncbi:MAG: translocation/assembly module TamB domain-containing protein [Desulfamplus sp.]|nr:translocation/assembly module TamB domain-containing protein [Desulfamplus sp.]MBF0302967.1 translocation/assembly module TamB domain-containing protein [Desulfamplus sp.]